MLPRTEGAFRTELMRLLERLSAWSEDREESEEGRALSKLWDRSRLVRCGRGKEAKLSNEVEWSDKWRMFGKRGGNESGSSRFGVGNGLSA